jgi:hypothetical protein
VLIRLLDFRPGASGPQTPADATLSEPLPNLSVYKLRAATVRGIIRFKVTAQVCRIDKSPSCGVNSQNKELVSGVRAYLP